MGGVLTEGDWRLMLWQKLQTLNWSRIVDDVKPFVEPNFNLSLLKLEAFERILKI